MLIFTYNKNNKGKILFNEIDRLDFDKLRSMFRYENKQAKFSKFKYQMNNFKYAISPLGQFNIGQTFDFIEACKQNNIEYKIEDKLNEIICPKLNITNIESVPNTKYVYRDYQLRLLEQLCKQGRGVIISPTRSGKSLIIAGLCHNVLLNSKKNDIRNILIIVPNLQLVEQFFDDLNEYYFPEHPWNIVKFCSGEQKKNKDKFIFEKRNIIISNIQWLMLHGDELPYIDMLIQDECHFLKNGNEISKLVKGVDIPFKFGCTGTLPKQDEDIWSITGIFGKIVDEIKIQELQEKKVLQDVNIIPIKFIHNKKVSFIDKDQKNEDILEQYQAAYRKEQMYLQTNDSTNKIIVDIQKQVIKQHKNWNVLILFDYISAGENLFNLLDYENKHYIDGSIEVNQRKDIVEQMNDPNGGQITIQNCTCFGTGITIKNIEQIFLCTSQSSVTKIIQSIGRGLRRVEKETLNIFDILHNYKYSEKHFNERCELYKEFYNKKLNKDFQLKEINIK